jgi:hypothetical protein
MVWNGDSLSAHHEKVHEANNSRQNLLLALYRIKLLTKMVKPLTVSFDMGWPKGAYPSTIGHTFLIDVGTGRVARKIGLFKCRDVVISRKGVSAIDIRRITVRKLRAGSSKGDGRHHA